MATCIVGLPLLIETFKGETSSLYQNVFHSLCFCIMNDILYRDLSGELNNLILGGAVNNNASDGMFCFNANNDYFNSN